MKVKAINKNTNQQFDCEEVEIDGYKYYINSIDKDFRINENSIYKKWKIGIVTNVNEDILEFEGEFIDESNLYKIICSNNPNIDIPKVVDEVEELADNYVKGQPIRNRSLSNDGWNATGFVNGYNKSQATHPFSEEDMIDFAEFYFREEFNSTMQDYKPSKEILRLWKEQQPKIVYYE